MNQPSKKIVNPYNKYIFTTKVSLVVAIITLIIAIVAVTMTSLSHKHIEYLQTQISDQSKTVNQQLQQQSQSVSQQLQTQSETIRKMDTTSQVAIHHLNEEWEDHSQLLRSMSRHLTEAHEHGDEEQIDLAIHQLQLAQLQLATQINTAFSIKLLDSAQRALSTATNLQQRKPFINSIDQISKQLNGAKNVDVQSTIQTISKLRQQILTLSFTPQKNMTDPKVTHSSSTASLSTREARRKAVKNTLKQLFTVQYHKVPISVIKHTEQITQFQQYLLLKLSELEWSLLNNHDDLYTSSLNTIMQEVKNIQINPDEKNAINQQIQSLYKVKFGFPREAVISELDDLVLNLSKFIVNIDNKKTPPMPSKVSSSINKPAGD